MRNLRLLCLLLTLAGISCEPPAKPGGGPAPSDNKSDTERGTIAVTIDGREATPEETQAFGAFAHKLLSDAVHEAINKASKEALKKLDITDPVEVALLSVSFGPTASSEAELWSIHLIRPGKEGKTPRTIALSRDGKVILRFTRTTGPVERPIAVMSSTEMRDGRLSQTELFLVYGPDGKWKQYRPSERKESLSGDQK